MRGILDPSGVVFYGCGLIRGKATGEAGHRPLYIFSRESVRAVGILHAFQWQSSVKSVLKYVNEEDVGMQYLLS